MKSNTLVDAIQDYPCVGEYMVNADAKLLASQQREWEYELALEWVTVSNLSLTSFINQDQDVVYQFGKHFGNTPLEAIQSAMKSAGKEGL